MKIDLSKLPVQTCWPGEPAPLITWPLVVTKGPGDAREDNYNLGIYRMQVLNKNQTVMRWLKHRGGAQHHQRWAKEKTAPLPAAVVLGADPGIILAAVTPVPGNLVGISIRGPVAGSGDGAGRLRFQPLKVPAEAEIVIEGEVSLARTATRAGLATIRLLQFGGAVSRLHGHRNHHAEESDLSLHLHLAPAGRAVDPG